MKTKTKTNEQIKVHEDEYYHIPRLALLPVLGFIVFSLLSIGNYQLINKEVIKVAFTCVDECNVLKLNDLMNLYPIIAEYILISLAIISLVAVFKGGFNNLKPYDKKGLIEGLILGLIIGGLIGGLIIGLIIEGLILGLIIGLIIGLIMGLIKEFE